MEILIKIQKKIELSLVYLAGVLLILLMIVISAESLLRKFANYSIPGIFEIASQLMVGITILGIAYVQSEKEHIQVDIMNKVFSQFLLKVTDFFSYLIGLFLASIFGYQGFFKFIESYQTGETAMGIISVPFWPGRLAIFLAMFLLCTRFLIDIILLFMNKERVAATFTEAPDVIKIEEDFIQQSQYVDQR
ncbi:TRAP transporter small permease subunit [Solibacillus sp. FSL K6-1523]|uniref:TRAP transporter small permease subunit n=1 Tax=Solibacillus sp. FSL K6-1523 TaxID=2921471 RepID=UPI0030F92EC5